MVGRSGGGAGSPEAPLTSYGCHLYIAGKPRRSVAGYLSLVQGQDQWGAGVTVYWNEPTGGRYSRPVELYRARWDVPPTSVREALEVASRALAEALAHLGYTVGETLG